jgi:hypothetical protein
MIHKNVLSFATTPRFRRYFSLFIGQSISNYHFRVHNTHLDHAHTKRMLSTYNSCVHNVTEFYKDL